MDRNRLILFIALSALITFGFQYLVPGRRPVPATTAAVTQNQPPGSSPLSRVLAPAGHQPSPVASPTGPTADAPRAKIDAPRVVGSISLIGARLDDLRLRDYRDTVSKTSPLVRILEPAGDPSRATSNSAGPAAMA